MDKKWKNQTLKPLLETCVRVLDELGEDISAQSKLIDDLFGHSNEIAHERHFFCGACIKSYGSSLSRPRLSGQVQEFVNDVVIPARDLYTKPMFTKKT